MKVLLVGNYAADAQQSMQGFVRSLASGLPKENIEVQVLAPRTHLARADRNTHTGANKWLAYIDKYALFPPVLRRAARGMDVVHIGDHSNAIYVRHLANRTHVLTCHDLLAVRAGRGEPNLWNVGRSGQFYQKLIWQGIKCARNVVCVSDATQQDMLRLLADDVANTGDVAPPSLQQRRITLIYNGVYRPLTPIVNLEERRALLAECGVTDRDSPFLLFVGSNLARKNRLGALRIFSALRQSETASLASGNPLRFVIAGQPFTEETRRFLHENNLTETVVECANPSDRQVQALYSHAAGLLFPTLHEGFGLPIIEAQACDCPVFTTGRAPMTEAGGSAAAYFDPDKPDEAARIVREGLQADKRREMIARGRINAARFTNEEMVSRYAALYREIA